MPKRRTAGFVGFITMVIGALGCRSTPGCPADPREAEPARPVFSPGSGYARDDAFAAQLGSEAFWNATTDRGGRVVLSVAPKNGDVPSQLGAYVAYVDRAFTTRITDRRVNILGLNGDNSGLRLLEEHGVPWVAIAYTRDEHTDPSVRGASCDSAALIMDFGSEYWTLSWNATRGTLSTRAQEMDVFLSSLSIGPRLP